MREYVHRRSHARSLDRSLDRSPEKEVDLGCGWNGYDCSRDWEIDDADGHGHGTERVSVNTIVDGFY